MSDFKGRHFEGEIVLWAVRWYCRYGVSYRDLEQMMGERGVPVDHIPDGRGDGVARPVSSNSGRHRGAASVAGSRMLRGDTLTSQTDHRQERCIAQSAKSAKFASKRRTHRWLRGEQRDHWPAGIDRCRQPRLSFSPDVRMGRSCGECRLTSRHRASRTP